LGVATAPGTSAAAAVPPTQTADTSARQEPGAPDPTAIAPAAPSPTVAAPMVKAPVSEDPPVQQQDVTDPNHNVSQPEDALMSSFTAAPDGRTVFATGQNRNCAGQVTCPAALFVTHDGGATWTRLAASNFNGDTVLLPAGYGSTDDRIFANDATGILTVSTNGGASFAPAAVGSPQFRGAAAISPAFDAGDPRIVIGSQPSMVQYDDGTKSMQPAAYTALPGGVNPVFATKDVLLAGGQTLDENGDWRSAVFRCGGPVCTTVSISRHTNAAPKLRLSPDFRTDSKLYAFTDRELFTSADGGASFSTVATPWFGSYLADLALGAGGELFAAVESAHGNASDGLYTSSDGGTSWTKVASGALSDRGITAVDVAGSRVFAALAGGGVACSSDLGTSWAARC